MAQSNCEAGGGGGGGDNILNSLMIYNNLL